MLEGYFFYRALVTVFETSRVSRLAHHALGWGVPLLVVAACLITEAASSATVYTRPGACWSPRRLRPVLVGGGGHMHDLRTRTRTASVVP